MVEKPQYFFPKRQKNLPAFVSLEYLFPILQTWRIVWSSVNVEHPLHGDETAEDVDEGDQGSDGGQALDDIGGVVAAAHQVKCTNGRDARDGDVDGHQW
jgi:hypothetical protein